MNRPKDHGVMTVDIVKNTKKNTNDLNRSVDVRKPKNMSTTYDRIFGPKKPKVNLLRKKRYVNNHKDSIGKILEEQGKIAIKPVSGKISNDDFNVLSLEAKKNFLERYYIEEN